MLKSIFGSFVGGFFFTVGFLLLLIVGSVWYGVYYISNNYTPAVMVGILMIGIPLPVGVFLIFSLIDFLRDGVRGIQETRRFREDQESDTKMLMAMSNMRNQQLLEMQRSVGLQRNQLQLERQVLEMEPIEEEDPVSVGEQLW